MAKEYGKAEVLNYEEVDVGEALKEMTGGRGPDACDAVGMEAHGWSHGILRPGKASSTSGNRPTTLTVIVA